MIEVMMCVALAAIEGFRGNLYVSGFATGIGFALALLWLDDRAALKRKQRPADLPAERRSTGLPN